MFLMGKHVKIFVVYVVQSQKEVMRNNNEKKHSAELKIYSCLKTRNTWEEMNNDYNCMMQSILNGDDSFYNEHRA